MILNTDVTNSNFHKEVITVDIGTKAKSHFAENLILDEKQVANESVDGDNKELQKCLLQKTLCENTSQRAQSKIEMGLKRKKELESETDCLVLKKAKLLKGKV